MPKMSNFSPACGYEGDHYHAPGLDPNCLGCYVLEHPEEDDE
jgi:hypothetical protein